MPDDINISIAKDFSPFPAGRDGDDGTFNGRRFRKDHLLPKILKAIEEGSKLVVSFDGVQACGSSFLESSFGGLVREEGVDRSELIKHLSFEYSSNRYRRFEESARLHIRNARPS